MKRKVRFQIFVLSQFFNFGLVKLYGRDVEQFLAIVFYRSGYFSVVL